MNILYFAGTLFALLLTGALCLLLRMFSDSRITQVGGLSDTDFSWDDYPLHRLLMNAEFDYLRASGISRARVGRLRAERRRIFRLCLRSMRLDFNRVQHAMKFVLVLSKEDRPDLAAQMAKSRIAFYRNLLRAEAGLLWHACGFEYAPAIDVLRPLKGMREELERLVAMPALAGSAA